MLNIRLDCSWSLGRDIPQPLDAALFRLLGAIENTGSLNQAARKIGMSYRYSWGLIGKWAQCLGEPLVVMKRGRGAHLTAFGENLLRSEKYVRTRLAPHL